MPRSITLIQRALSTVILCTLVTTIPADASAAEQDAIDKLKQRAAALNKEFGDGYTIQVDVTRNMVYVSALDKDTFGRVSTMLAAYRDAQLGTLFKKPFAQPVSVVFPTERDYRERVPWTKATGFYSFRSRTLTSINLSGIMIHEFTHALHHNDMALAEQKHPIWIAEGFATLFQLSETKGGLLVPKVDNQLDAMQLKLRMKQHTPLAEFVKLDQEGFLDSSTPHYRQARYLMLYLQRLNKLEAFYTTYKKTYDKDPTGRQALEKTLGVALPQIETNWRTWVLGLTPPWQPGGKVVAHLGIRMKPHDDGVKVDALLRGGAAHQGGVLKPGDVIVKIAGRPTPSAKELTAVVRSLLPRQTVDIELIRGGHRVVVKQLLGAIRSRAD